MPRTTSRSAVLRTATAVAALATSLLVTGCGVGNRPALQAPPPAAQVAGATQSAPPGPPGVAVSTTTTMIMIIRHGEKPDDGELGVDAAGKADSSSLTRTGWDRAHRLVDLLDPAQGAPRPGLARPTAIYAAGANDDGEGKRTRETVEPLSDELGITTDTHYGKGDEEALVEHVLKQPGPTLIAWQHGEIPAIAEALPSVTPTPPSEWPDDRFDVVWTFTRTADGWHFAQVPELLLRHDVADVIED